MEPLQLTLFNIAGTALNEGHPLKAKELLLEVIDGGHATVEVYHLLAICHRLLGEQTDSDRRFAQAFSLVQNSVVRGQILRDWAMLALEQGRVDRARCRLESSLRELQHHDVDDARLSEEEKQRKLFEYFVSIGFQARYEAAINDRRAARDNYRLADTKLRGQAPQELNNLVWWMKVAPLRERIKLGRRGFALAWQAHNRERQIEVVLLTVSPGKAAKVRSWWTSRRAR